MHVGVFRRIGPRHRVDHRLRLLRRGAVVEIDQRPPVHLARRGSGSPGAPPRRRTSARLLRREAEDREQHAQCRRTARSRSAPPRRARPPGSGSRAARRRSWRRPRAPRRIATIASSAASGGSSASATSCAAWISTIIAFSQTTSASAPQSSPLPAEQPPDPHGQEDHDAMTASCTAAPSSGLPSTAADTMSTPPGLMREREVAEHHADAGHQHRRLAARAVGHAGAEHLPRRRARPHQAVDDQLRPTSVRVPPPHAPAAGHERRAGRRPRPSARGHHRRHPAGRRRSPPPRRGSPRTARARTPARHSRASEPGNERRRGASAATPTSASRSATGAPSSADQNSAARAPRKPPARAEARARRGAPAPPARRRAAAPAPGSRRDAPRPPPSTGSSMPSARASRSAFGRLATKKQPAGQHQVDERPRLAQARPRPARAIAPRGSRQPRPIASTSPSAIVMLRRRASQPASRSRIVVGERRVLDLGDRLVDEGEHQQLLGRPPRDAARGQVEERGLVDRAAGRAVAALHVVGVDLELGLGQELARLVEQQPLADLVAVGLLRPGLHQDLALEDPDRAAAQHLLEHLPALAAHGAVGDEDRVVVHGSRRRRRRRRRRAPPRRRR